MGAVALVVLSVPSLLWSILAADALATGNYFSTTQRVWELCLGGAIALLPAWSGRAGLVTRSSTAILGLVVVLASAVLITPSLPYPGVVALVPCVATAMVLWADGDALASRGVWRAGWIQWLGDRSYSVYLCHWPLLLVANTIVEGRVVGTVAAIILTLALSEVTYRQVEQRFRFRAPRAPARRPAIRSVAALVVATMVTGAGGLVLAAPRDEGHLRPSLEARGVTRCPSTVVESPALRDPPVT